MTWLAALSYARRYWWAPIILGLAAGLLITRGTLTARTNALKAEIAAHAQTVAGYKAATEIARRKDAENVLRMKSRQDAITKEVANDYQADLAALRTRYERLRDAQRHPGGGGSATVPATSATACRVDGPAEGDGFSLPARLIATEQALQLSALQTWVRAQSAVSTGDDAK